MSRVSLAGCREWGYALSQSQIYIQISERQNFTTAFLFVLKCFLWVVCFWWDAGLGFRA